MRDWLYVEDHARAIDIIFHKGKIADTYNIGGFNEWKNIDLIKVIIKTVDRLLGNPEGHSLRLITYVTDRKGHDLRYAIDSNKLKKELGWEPSLQFEEGIEKTVKWYLDNQEWMENVTSGEYLKYYQKCIAIIWGKSSGCSKETLVRRKQCTKIRSAKAHNTIQPKKGRKKRGIAITFQKQKKRDLPNRKELWIPLWIPRDGHSGQVDRQNLFTRASFSSVSKQKPAKTPGRAWQKTTYRKAPREGNGDHPADGHFYTVKRACAEVVADDRSCTPVVKPLIGKKPAAGRSEGSSWIQRKDLTPQTHSRPWISSQW